MISNPGLPRHEVRILDIRPARSISRFLIILGLSKVIFGNFKLDCVFVVRISLEVCRVMNIIFADIVSILATAPSYDEVNIFTRCSTTSLAMISINNPSCDPFVYNTLLEGQHEITSSPNICFHEFDNFVRIVFIYVISKLRLCNADRFSGTS